jgi:hypothetical protein
MTGVTATDGQRYLDHIAWDIGRRTDMGRPGMLAQVWSAVAVWPDPAYIARMTSERVVRARE